MSIDTWVVTFAYSGSGRREFFDREFEVNADSEGIDKIIKNYVLSQNKGEAKSDRIRYWSKTKTTCPECNGEGEVEKNIHRGEEGMQIEMDVMVVCNECGGSGKIKKT